MLLLPFFLYASVLFSPAGDDEVIFMVDPYHDESGWYAEPIAIMRNGNYISVVDPSDTSFAPYRAFSNIYFRSGKRYPVFRNDEQLGEMTVVAADSEFACMQLTAQVQVKYAGKQKLSLGEPGLAFSAPGSHKPIRSGDGTPADSALALKLAAKEFTKQKVSKAALKKLQLNRLRKVDLDGDDTLETIATFETMQIRYSKSLKMDMTMIYFLTLVIDNEGITYSYYISGAEEGDENGHFASRQDIAGISDLDADGVAEIVFRNFYYEAWDYSIVKRKAGRWQQVWQGGGGGC